MWLLIFLVETLLIVRYEKNHYGTFYTPAIFLAAPAMIIFVLTYLFGEQFGFYPMHTSCFSIWCFGLALFFITGLFVSSLLGINKRNEPFKLPVVPQKTINHQLLTLIGLTTSVIFLFLAYQSLQKYTFGTEDYLEYVSKDTFAHLCMFLRYIAMYSIVCFKRKLTLNNICHFIIIVTAIISAIFYGSKTALFLTIFCGFFARLLIFNITIRFKFKYLVYFLAIIFGVFYTVYSLRFGEQADLEWTFKHVIQYAGYGIESFSQHFYYDQPIGVQWERLCFSFISVWNKITGQPPIEMINLWNSAGLEIEGNVHTFFGCIYICGGIVGGIITTILCGIISYVLFYLALEKNIFFIFLYCILLTSFLIYGWFDYAIFNTIWFYEYIFIASLFSIIIKRV
jgi:oligosaccharide repeat unit polymerase